MLLVHGFVHDLGIIVFDRLLRIGNLWRRSCLLARPCRRSYILSRADDVPVGWAYVVVACSFYRVIKCHELQRSGKVSCG